MLLRVHIIGGSLDVTKHLRDVHLRVGVVRGLLEELIARGFPGYKHYRAEDVTQRLRDLYGQDDAAEFIPAEVQAEIESSRRSSRDRKDAAPPAAEQASVPPADYGGAGAPDAALPRAHTRGQRGTLRDP